MTNVPIFRKGQTVWRQHNGEVQSGKIYEVARVKFRSQGYDEDEDGTDFIYRASFGDVWSDRTEQHNDGEVWDTTFSSVKKEAYRKLAAVAAVIILEKIADLAKWAKIKVEADQNSR